MMKKSMKETIAEKKKRIVRELKNKKNVSVSFIQTRYKIGFKMAVDIYKELTKKRIGGGISQDAMRIYWQDACLSDVFGCFIRLYKDVVEGRYYGEMYDSRLDDSHNILIDNLTGSLMIDSQPINPIAYEDWLYDLGGGTDFDVYGYVKKVSGIDVKDYYDEIFYDNGTSETVKVERKRK